jgi:hypothetical protein
VSERTAADIRAEIASERQGLDEDLARLQSEIRSVALLVAAGLVVVGLLASRKGGRRAAVSVWKIVR